MSVGKPLLHQLLQEDQEPFLLKNYIADRKYQLKKIATTTTSSRTQLKIKKRKPTSSSNYFPSNFCKNACFYSVNNSPDLRKSPLFDFQSPVKTPCRSPNAILLHIPAKTAALLLEAALRIQKQTSSSKPKNITNRKFGLFGSLIKRLTHRGHTQKQENKDKEAIVEIVMVSDVNARPSSVVWSESNEEKSWDLDLETSSSSSGQYEEEDDEFEFVNNIMDVDGLDDFDNHFCENPFHFVLRRSPPAGNRTPVLSSPVTSPRRLKSEGKENNDVESLKKFQEKEEEEEEEKEQCSPISVLDPPFQDDDDGHDDQSEDDGFDLECSYAIVQRAHQQLLRKLRRFEKLAELDPVELEKRMMEQDQKFDDENGDVLDLEEELEEMECEVDNRLLPSDNEHNIDRLVMEELSKSSFCRLRKIPRDMKRLVSDLINEEEKEEKYLANKEAMVKRVCKRFESWKDVECNTIDMMVEQDFKKEFDGWKMHQEQLGNAALEIEIGIFGLLVQEMTEELVGLTWI